MRHPVRFAVLAAALVAAVAALAIADIVVRALMLAPGAPVS